MPIEWCALSIYVFFALLIAATTKAESSQVGPRLLLGSWLAFLLLLGMQNTQNIISSRISGNSPWAGPFFVGLLISFVLIMVVQKRVTFERAISLTVGTGFIIILMGYVFDFILQPFIFLDTTLNNRGASEYFPPDWVKQVIYVTFGYNIARRKGWLAGITGSVLLALVVIMLDWLALVIYGLSNGFFPPSLPESWVPELVGHALAGSTRDVIVLAFYGILGVICAQIIWTRTSYESVDSTA